MSFTLGWCGQECIGINVTLNAGMNIALCVYLCLCININAWLYVCREPLNGKVCGNFCQIFQNQFLEILELTV